MNLRHIERSVIDGFVINKRGEWCSINEALEEEIYYMQHLENGEIIKDGMWVKIDEVFIEDSPEKRGAAGTRHAPDPEDSVKTTDTQKIVIQTPPDKHDSKSNKKESKKDGRVATPLQERDRSGYSETSVNRNTQPEVADGAVETGKTPVNIQRGRGEVFDRKIEVFEANLAGKESKNRNNEPPKLPAPVERAEAGASKDINPESSVHKNAPVNTLDDWDRARRGNNTVLIISLAAVLAAVVAILLIVL